MNILVLDDARSRMTLRQVVDLARAYASWP